MHALTAGLQSHQNLLPLSSKINRILICRPNGRLGNMLLLTPLVREIHDAFPHATIDLFVKGPQASRVFREFPQMGRIIELPDRPFANLWRYAVTWAKLRQTKYDLVFNVDAGSSSGRLSTKFARGDYKDFGQGHNLDRYPDAVHMAKNPVYRFREFLAALQLQPRNARLPELSLCLTREEKTQGAQKLHALIRNSNPVVGLFTYATGNKDMGKDWWQSMLLLLKEELPQVNFIELLPAHGVSNLDYKVPSVYSRNIREMAGVASNFQAFIGADSGVMHLASASGVPVIGLFTVTRKDRYAPYNRQSIGMDMNVHSTEDVVRKLKRIIGPKAMLAPSPMLLREIAN